MERKSLRKYDYRANPYAPFPHKEEVEEETSSALTRSGVIQRSRKKREAEALRRQKWQEKVARMKKGKEKREKLKNPIKVKLAKNKEINHTMTDKTPKGYGPSEEDDMFDEARMG